MKSFDQDTLDMLASGRAASRGMLLFDLGSGLYGFWTGLGTLEYQGVQYVGAGSLIEVEDINMGTELAAIPLICRLTSIPNTALTPDILATIEQEQYHQRPAFVSRAYIHPDTRTLLSVERLYRGYIDRIEHEDTLGGQAVLTVYLESKARDNLKRGYRSRSDTDQRRIDANDGSLRYAATVGAQEIMWGRSPESA